MALVKRYSRARVFGIGSSYGTSFAITTIRENIQNGNIRYEELTLEENERLDILAGKYYGDGRLYWVIAAASGIGWALQCPPGTHIVIPSLEDVARFVG